MAAVILRLKVSRWRIRLAKAAIRVIAPFVRTDAQAEWICARLGAFVIRGFKVQ